MWAHMAKNFATRTTISESILSITSGPISTWFLLSPRFRAFSSYTRSGWGLKALYACVGFRF